MNESLKAYKKLLGVPDIKNPRCDGAWCTEEDSEVRILQIGEGNAHVCRACFLSEMRMRQTFNDHYGVNLDDPAWSNLAIVAPSEASGLPPQAGIEEGSECNRNGCQGIMGYDKVEQCSCHLGSAPCSGCVSNPLICIACGFKVEDNEFGK